MSAYGNYGGIILGTHPVLEYLARIGNSTALGDVKANNAGFAVRFTANSTKDIKGVYIYNGTVTTPGAFTLSVQTIDATSGKPTGTLYDANATKSSVTPTAGWQLVQWASLPTAGLTAGTEYAVVLATTSASTAHTLWYIGEGYWPTCILTTATVGTPSSFAEQASVCPIFYFLMEDDTVEAIGTMPFIRAGDVAGNRIYGTRGAGSQIILNQGAYVRGMMNAGMLKSGASISNIRGQIYDSTGTLVAGCTRTIDKDSLSTFSGGNGNRLCAHFDSAVYLRQGTYYALWDQNAGGNSSNYFVPMQLTTNDAALVAQNCLYAFTTNVSSWAAPSVTTTSPGPTSLILDSTPAEFPPNFRQSLRGLIQR